MTVYNSQSSNDGLDSSPMTEWGIYCKITGFFKRYFIFTTMEKKKNVSEIFLTHIPK